MWPNVHIMWNTSNNKVKKKFVHILLNTSKNKVKKRVISQYKDNIIVHCQVSPHVADWLTDNQSTLN